MADKPFRILPELTDRNRHFWQGGRDGRLVLLRCQSCGYYLHPPTPVCPRDRSKNLAPEAVSGRATVASFTVNHHPWVPGADLPYVVAIVELPEQAGAAPDHQPGALRPIIGVDRHGGDRGVRAP